MFDCCECGLREWASVRRETARLLEGKLLIQSSCLRSVNGVWPITSHYLDRGITSPRERHAFL